MSFILTNRIIQERPTGLCSAVIEGRRGIGKSAYCLKVGKEVYQQMYKCSDTEAYRLALKYTLYDMGDIINVLQDAISRDETLPMVTWDDAGVHASSILWFFKMEEVHKLKAITDTIRSAVTGFLLNCPDRSSLLSFLRNYDDYLVEIVRNNKPCGGSTTYTSKKTGDVIRYKSYERIARGYTIFKLPSGKKLVYKNYEDEYSCYLPNDVYEEYDKKRKYYLAAALKELKELETEHAAKKKTTGVEMVIKKIELQEKIEKMRKKNKDIDIDDLDFDDKK